MNDRTRHRLERQWAEMKDREQEAARMPEVDDE